jgi:putative phosphoribosyl transferase
MPPTLTCVSKLLLSATASVVAVDLTSGVNGAHHVNEPMRRHAIHVLAQRLVATTEWLRRYRATCALPVAYVGTGLAASAACAAAVARADDAACIVSWDGRLDLVGHDLLNRLRAPVLLLVSEGDHELAVETRMACAHLRTEHSLKVVPRAERTNVDDALGQVEAYTRVWLNECLRADDHVTANIGPSAMLARDAQAS